LRTRHRKIRKVSVPSVEQSKLKAFAPDTSKESFHFDPNGGFTTSVSSRNLWEARRKQLKLDTEAPLMLKVDILSVRRPDMTHEQFLKHWRDVHANLFSSQPVVKQHVRRYVQSRTIPTTPDGVSIANVDGIAQIWFDDMAGFHGVFSSQNYRDVIRVDEEKFTDGKKVQFIFSEETPIIS
jgi:uncharacterized protein (TIGR02118 family)